MQKQKYAFCSVLCIVALILSGLQSQIVRAEKADFDTLYLSQYEPQTLDPTLAQFTDDIVVIHQLFSGLFRIDEAGEVIPDLALDRSWNVEGTQITINLRSGLVWSDGHPLTASDVRFGILRALSPSLEAPYANFLFGIVNASEYKEGTITDPDLVGIEVLSPTQIRMTLENPDIFFERILSMWVAYPLPEHVINVHPTDWTDPAYMVSSGSYRLVEWLPGQGIHLDANLNYYDPSAQLISAVEIDFDQDTAWDRYLTGNLDSITIQANHLPDAADTVLIDEKVIIPGTCTYAVFFKVDQAPFNLLNVRKAFTAAINRQAYVDAAMSGFGIPVQTFAAQSVFGSVDGISLGIGIPYHADQARQYLSDAGYPNGVGFPDVTVQVRDTSFNHIRWNFLTAAWSSVLNVNIQVEYVSYNPSNQPLFLNGWCADYDEAINFLRDGVNFYRTRNGNWQSPAYDALVDQAVQTPANDERILFYQSMEEILTETDVILIPLSNTSLGFLTKPYLERAFSSFSDDRYGEWSFVSMQETNYHPAEALNFNPELDHVRYQFPANMLSIDMTLSHSSLRPEDITIPNGRASVGGIFRLDAVLAPGQKSAQTLAPYTIQMNYSPEELLVAPIFDEAALSLYARVDGQWVEQSTVVNTTDHLISATTQWINTDFVVMGRSWNYLYLPNIRR